MSVFQAIVLGIVQGITEFAPVSSSGHLILVPWLLHWKILDDPVLNKTFDVALHFGTLIGVVIYFWPRLVTLLAGLGRLLPRFRIEGDPDRRLALFVIISTLPGAALGWKAGDLIEQRLGSAIVVAALTVGFGVVLWMADRWGKKRRPLAEYGWRDSVLIGVAQAAALVPGVSRSGITMTAALTLGSERRAAAYYSFLISVPIIGGAVAKKLVDIARTGLPAGMTWPFIAGTLAAAVSGYLCIRFVLRYLQTRSLTPFVWYRVAVGLALLVLALRRL